MERRVMPRASLGPMFLNKYIDGYPHMVRLVDASAGGLLVDKMGEPDVARDFYPIELGVPGQSERLWLWTRPVWQQGQRQALRVIGIDPVDRARLRRMVDEARPS